MGRPTVRAVPGAPAVVRGPFCVASWRRPWSDRLGPADLVAGFPGQRTASWPPVFVFASTWWPVFVDPITNPGARPGGTWCAVR